MVPPDQKSTYTPSPSKSPDQEARSISARIHKALRCLEDREKNNVKFNVDNQMVALRIRLM